MIARDGEGATKLVTVTVAGATSSSTPRRPRSRSRTHRSSRPRCSATTRTGAGSRGALGSSGAELDPDTFDIDFAGIHVCRGGAAVGFDEAEALEALKQPEVTIEVDLNLGESAATVWTCDLTYEYVRINGEYRS